MNTDKILHVSLICLGSLGMFLSVLAASLIWTIPPCKPPAWCASPIFSPTFMCVVGVVNFILSAIPVIIGCVHVFAEKKCVALSIPFSILVVPNIVALAFFNLVYLIYNISGSGHFAWYFKFRIGMSFLYVIEIILCWVAFGRKSSSEWRLNFVMNYKISQIFPPSVTYFFAQKLQWIYCYQLIGTLQYIRTEYNWYFHLGGWGWKIKI